MKKAILGQKLGMTQIFDENGKLIPVTVISAGPCQVIQKKTIENDGYEALQLGYVDKNEKHTTKPLQGHFKKAGTSFKRYLREFKLDNYADLNVGDTIGADVFEAAEKVDVTGTSKGKGFQGPIKRWGTHRGPMTHGSGYHRHGGSLGACSTPSRVMKGKKMAGHMGSNKTTVQNLEIVRVDAEKNFVLIKGAVPGPKGGLVIIKNTVKA